MNGSDQMPQLIDYIIALTNLYGIVHKNRVQTIYNQQHSEPVTEEELQLILDNPPSTLEKAFVVVYQDYFVHEFIIEERLFDELMLKKGRKPYYIPEKEELLLYIDESYFEKTPQYRRLLKYIKKHFISNDEKAEWLCDDIQLIGQVDRDMQDVMYQFDRRQIEFKDMNQLNDIIQLVKELFNATRIWENNGYTPNELFEKFKKPGLGERSLSTLELHPSFVQTPPIAHKIGRNDPCPCGSGKKYKKCCLGKIGM